MVGLHFNPADIQSMGIGLAAFLATILALFVFLSARRSPSGRALFYTFAAGAVWAWSGFLYHIVSDIEIARQLRVVSVIGIVLICLSELFFALVYLRERIQPSSWVEGISRFLYGGALLLLLALAADLLGTHLIVGALLEPSHTALAPQAGPFMGVLIAFYIASVLFCGALLSLRARTATDEADRRRALILCAGMTAGLLLGGTRFTPWYGFDFYPVIGGIGYPLYVFALLYAVRQYRLFNLEVAAAQLLIFILWTFTFFRILLAPTLSAAIPDMALFAAAIVIGVLLMRSVIAEMHSQREIAKLLVDKAKSEFITVAAHQLRTPASAVRWSFELLGEHMDSLPTEQRTIVEHGKRAAGNLVHIINDLLDIGRMGDGQFRYNRKPGSIAALGSDTVKLMEGVAARKRVTLSARIAEDIPPICIDPDKLGLALQNLLDNAIKYTPEGGTVAFEVQRDREHVRISVRDTGIGFTEEEKKRVFEKFFRGARAVRISPDGSGLGLVIAKTIVEGHGGTISLVSQEEKGTDISILLPMNGPERG